MGRLASIGERTDSGHFVIHLKERDKLEELGIDGRIIFKPISKNKMLAVGRD